MKHQHNLTPYIRSRKNFLLDLLHVLDPIKDIHFCDAKIFHVDL